jgi:hypothetical protein|tara:strand:+ start:292 stop:453 length:162 start_codon:yes stop_codon:yes gene_type:complete
MNSGLLLLIFFFLGLGKLAASGRALKQPTFLAFFATLFLAALIRSLDFAALFA